jgi:hypothetical protein
MPPGEGCETVTSDGTSFKTRRSQQKMKRAHTRRVTSIRRRQLNTSRFAVIAPFAVMLALAVSVGVALGAIPDSGGVIHSCYQTHSGRLRVISQHTGEHCRQSETPLTWNQQGPGGPPGPQGPRGAQGPAGPQGPGGQDIVASSPSNTNLSTVGGTVTPVVTIKLPTSPDGTHYVVTAQGDLVNFGPSDYTRCNLVVSGTQVAAVSTMVGDPAASGAQGPAAFLSPFALTGAVNVPATGATAVLGCWHDNTNGATPYVDVGAAVWAHQTTSLKIES